MAWAEGWRWSLEEGGEGRQEGREAERLELGSCQGLSGDISQWYGSRWRGEVWRLRLLVLQVWRVRDSEHKQPINRHHHLTLSPTGLRKTFPSTSCHS